MALAPTPVHAGLRPIYGGELVVTAPTAPLATAPAEAWSVIEVVLANALGAPLSSVLAGPVQSVGGRQVRFSLSPEAAWPDGRPLDAAGLVAALANARATAAVSLPPFTFRAENDAVVAELPFALPTPEKYLALPWLRLARGGEGGGFKPGPAGAIEANPRGLGGRAFVDRLRIDVREGRRLDPHADGLVLGRAGLDGRPVFALPRPGGPAAAALVTELAKVNRESLVNLFVRGLARVPDDWPLPSSRPSAVAPSTVVIAVDAGERDLRTVAERLQVLLRDRSFTARVVAEERATFLRRLDAGAYDLALIPLPPAPPLVQAATLARLAKKGSETAVWKAAGHPKAPSEAEQLRRTAAALGAVLLYVEGGAVTSGGRVRSLSAPNPWDLGLCDAWLAPVGAAP